MDSCLAPHHGGKRAPKKAHSEVEKGANVILASVTTLGTCLQRPFTRTIANET